MKKVLVGFICFVIGAVSATSVTVLAESKAIEAFFNNIKVTVNGTELQMDTEPFIKDGRTMTPARFVVDGVCEALDAEGETKWNETTNTVEITVAKKEAEPVEKIITPDVINPDEDSSINNEQPITQEEDYNCKYVSSKITGAPFHLPWCEKVKNLKSDEIETYQTLQEVINKGHPVGCGICKPKEYKWPE